MVGPPGGNDIEGAVPAQAELGQAARGGPSGHDQQAERRHVAGRGGGGVVTHHAPHAAHVGAAAGAPAGDFSHLEAGGFGPREAMSGKRSFCLSCRAPRSPPRRQAGKLESGVATSSGSSTWQAQGDRRRPPRAADRLLRLGGVAGAGGAPGRRPGRACWRGGLDRRLGAGPRRRASNLVATLPSRSGTRRSEKPARKPKIMKIGSQDVVDVDSPAAPNADVDHVGHHQHPISSRRGDAPRSHPRTASMELASSRGPEARCLRRFQGRSRRRPERRRPRPRGTGAASSASAPRLGTMAMRIATSGAPSQARRANMQPREGMRGRLGCPA